MSAELADAARRIDDAANNATAQGPIDDALLSAKNAGDGAGLPGGSVVPAPGEIKRDPRGRKKGGKNRPKLAAKPHAAKPAAAAKVEPPAGDPGAAAPAPDKDYMKDALSGLVFMVIERSKLSGWPSPGMGLMEDREWCIAFSDALDKVIKKYSPAGFADYEAEIVLASLAIPYAFAVVVKVMNDRRKDNRVIRIHGEREDSHARDASAGVPAVDPDRPNDGQREFLPVGSVSPEPNGSGRTNAHA